MQTNYNSSPNFGMAMYIGEGAQKILAKKLTKEADIARLDGLVNAQRSNPFKVDIREEFGNLKAYIADVRDVEAPRLTVLGQNLFEKYFKSPIAFIERCCNLADKFNEEKYQTNLNPKLKSIFEQTKKVD